MLYQMKDFYRTGKDRIKAFCGGQLEADYEATILESLMAECAISE